MSRIRTSGGLAGILFAMVAVGALLSAVATGPAAAAATCAPIYVSSSGTTTNPAKVVEFAAGANGNVAPANTLGGPRYSKMVTASGIGQDAAGYTYVASPHINTVNVYAPGASGDVAPFAILKGNATTGVNNPGFNNPQGVVVRGNRLYVANGPFGSGLSGDPSIAVFALPLAAGPNNVAPVAVIAGPATKLNAPYGLALDSAGNIFVANVDNTITEYRPPAPSSYASPDNSAPILTIPIGPGAPEGLAIHGTTLYASTDDHMIKEYSLPSGTPGAVISGPNTLLANPVGIDVDSSGDLFVVNAQYDATGNQVLEFAPGASGNVAPIAVISGPATLLNSPQFVYIASCSGAATPPAITTSSLPAANVGVAYSQSLAATGGTGPYSWSLSAGALPAGLSLSPAGVISGTPTATGTSNFTVKVSDSSSPVQSSTKALSLSVGSSMSSVTITTTSPLPAAKIGVAYSKSLAATGGTSPYTWSLASGTLPAGLSLSSGGVISGTATTAGTSTFTVRATDASSPSQSATKTLSMTVIVPLKVTTTSPLPAARAGVAYSATLAAKGGTAPYVWSLSAGTLPAGLTLSKAGVVSGTPTTAGTFSFTAKVSDSTSPTVTAKKALTIVVS